MDVVDTFVVIYIGLGFLSVCTGRLSRELRSAVEEVNPSSPKNRMLESLALNDIGTHKKPPLLRVILFQALL